MLDLPTGDLRVIQTHDGETIGVRIGGIDIVQSRHIPEDDAYRFPQHNLIFVGSVAAFRYKMVKAQIRRDIFADLERQLDAFAKRVGVDRSTQSE